MMRNTPKWAWATALVVSVAGCSKEETPAPAPAPSVTPTPPPPPPPPPTASATASAVPEAGPPGPPVECPKGSEGEGSFAKPCEAKGGARMMEVKWTGKTDDKGPSFRIQNKGKQTILYGKIAVYFYDKAGKQLDVSDTSGTTPKPKPYHTCAGNMFGGVMKPGEKAVITFSCVPKSVVPDGAAAIEAEIPLVGFADESEKKANAFWRNSDLMPEARKKGGAK